MKENVWMLRGRQNILRRITIDILEKFRMVHMLFVTLKNIWGIKGNTEDFEDASWIEVMITSITL